MSSKKRLESIEDHNLTPREPMILWMKDAHQFGSFADWGRWLMTQPDDAYPLIRLPRQVYEAARAKNKGVRDEDLRDEFYRVQRDVIFLFYLHREINYRYERDQETFHLRGVCLCGGFRELVHLCYQIAQLRSERMSS